MDATKYIQCGLVKGCLYQVSFLPSRHAVKGNVVKLREENGVWNDGWKVVWIGCKSKSLDMLAEDRRVRKESGIAKLR